MSGNWLSGLFRCEFIGKFDFEEATFDFSSAKTPHVRFRIQGWEPIHYHGPHKLCKIAGGPHTLTNLILKFYSLPNGNKESKYV